MTGHLNVDLESPRILVNLALGENVIAAPVKIKELSVKGLVVRIADGGTLQGALAARASPFSVGTSAGCAKEEGKERTNLLGKSYLPGKVKCILR